MSIAAIGEENIYPGSNIEIDSKIVLTGSFTTPPGMLVVEFDLLDSENHVVVSGNPNIVTPSPMSNGYILRAQTMLRLPLDVVAGVDYTLNWRISYQDPTDASVTLKTTSTEIFSVFDRTEPEYGLQDTVVMDLSKIALQATVMDPGLTTNDITAKLYTPDNVEVADVTITPTVHGQAFVIDTTVDLSNIWTVKTNDGTIVIRDPTFTSPASYTLPTTGATVHAFLPGTNVRVTLLAALDPYMVHWFYSDGTMIGTSQAWLINDRMAGAMHEMKATLERAGRYPGLLESSLSNSDYVQFLKMGRDHFNGVGVITNFTMVGAEGTARRWWVICSLFEAAQSRELEEAVKAFDFSGLSTSLQVDITQAYGELKQQQQALIEGMVVPAKQRLAAKGIIDGDGSNQNTMAGRVQYAIGTTYSQVGNARLLYYGQSFGGLIGSYIGRFA